MQFKIFMEKSKKDLCSSQNNKEARDMLTFEDAKKIGIDACAEKIGRSFIREYADTSSTGYGDAEDHAFCYIGVDNRKRNIHHDEVCALWYIVR